MKRIICVSFFFLCLDAILFAAPWLVRNGDFRYSGASRALLSDWQIIAPTGVGYRLSGDNSLGDQGDRILFLKQEGGESALILQHVPLLAGRYRLTVELTSESTGCYALLQGTIVSGSGASGKLVAEVTLADDQEGAALQSGTSGPGEIGLVRIELDCLETAASPVPLGEGRALYSVLLPDNASEAEQFAAWETARLAKAITGHAPAIVVEDDGRPAFRLGAASTLSVPVSLPEDSFLIGVDDDGNLNLAGRNGRGVLYAVYEFFASQGCSWLTPGLEGETIPSRDCLSLPAETIVRSPLYEIRGTMLEYQMFQLDSGWRIPNYDDLLDWCLRNGLNSLWLARGRTVAYREWRGGSPMQTLGHSWRLFIRDDHPEWWPLVDGRRRKMSDLNLPNQPCLSNPELRDFAVDYIVAFFKQNPRFFSFSLCAEDEPCYWCECENCRKLDRDHGQGAWHRSGDLSPLNPTKDIEPLPMSDRTMDFVNEVARRVVAACPGRRIETYSYGSNREGPILCKVDANVINKYCYYLFTPPALFNDIQIRHLDSWRKAGMHTLAIYDYDNYLHPETVWSGLRYSFLSLLELHREYNAVHYMPESHQNVWCNPLLFRLRADALWGTTEPFEKLIARHCRRYFGTAGDFVSDYYLALDEAFRIGRNEMPRRDLRNNYDIIYCPELTLDNLEASRHFLDEARTLATGDPRLEKRIDWLVFAHDMTVQAVITNQNKIDFQCQALGPKAYHEARELAEKHHFEFSADCLNNLKSYYLPPIVQEEIQKLPLEWRFHTDAEKVGEQEKWFACAHPDWETIRTDSDWTSQGHGDFHGEAWYELEFDYTGEAKDNLAFYCEAIDGLAWFFLDGKPIGTQLEPPSKMWNQPFAITVPGLAPGRHVLHVKVAKDVFAAGIWKPVRIVALP